MRNCIQRTALNVVRFWKNSVITRTTLSSKFPIVTPIRPVSSSNVVNNSDRLSSSSDILELFDEENDLSASNELEVHKDLISRYHLKAIDSQNVVVVQPFVQCSDERNQELLLDESVALARTLEWRVLDTSILDINGYRKSDFFGNGNILKLQDLIGKYPQTSAVFLSTYRLTSQQRLNLEELLGIPVFDRYNVVLQIFQKHARTAEARLQVSLAEIPYLKARLFGDLEVENMAKHSPNRKGAEFFETREKMLKRREKRIKNKLLKLKEHRSVMRRSRQVQRIPTVAVVGYTNCGKTTLIKNLTGANLEPEDKLFATLDVTSHMATFPENLKALMIDTVGFISDIPTGLIASFSATLEDAALADVIVHVRDISHPDNEAQDANVRMTLKSLRIPQKLLDNMIVVGNKMDKLDTSSWPKLKTAGLLPISATQGHGIEVLERKIQKRIIDVTGRRKMKFRVKSGSQDFSWLMSNVTISHIEPDEKDGNYSLLSAIVLPGDVEAFKKFSLNNN